MAHGFSATSNALSPEPIGCTATAAIPGELARIGAGAEASGATFLSFMDHYFQIEPTSLPAEANMLEGYTTFGYLAVPFPADSERFDRLGEALRICDQRN